MIAFGQSKEADEYYKKGKELIDEGKFAEALPFFEKSNSLNKEQKEDTLLSSFAIAVCFHNIASNSYNIGDYHNAIKYQLRANDILKKALGEEHPDYALSLNNLAFYDSHIGNYTEAIKLGTQALEIRRKVLGEEHPDYALSLNNLTIDYAKIGNYTEAIRLGTQASEILKKILGEEHPDYALSLDNLAYLNNTIGNYTEAIRLGTQASEILKKILGEEHSDYAISLNNLASYYDEIGNHTEAIKLGTQALEILKKVFGEEHPFYATSLNNLAYCNSEIGNYTEAIRLGTRALEIHKKALGEEHPDYANSLANLAGYYENIGNYTEAIRLGTRALEIRKKALGGEHPDYAQSLNDLAVYYAIIGNNTEAIRLGTQALEIRKKALGGEHPDYAQSLNNLANYYFVINEYDKGGELLNQYYSIVHSNILHNFASMTATERNNYWTQKNYGSLNSIPQAAALSNTPKAYTLAYNFLLFTKGLLLYAELEIQKLIALSGNKDFEKRYYTLRENRIKLDKIYQQPLSQRTMNVDSIESLIEKDQKFLIEHIKELGDYTRNLSIEWQDVQNKLSDKDVAIEFANFKKDGKQYYIALILKQGMSAPEMVKISFLENDLANCYQSPSLYNAIWKPIEKYLNGVENVFFAPSGKLHTIAIEYLPDENGKIFAQKYNAYRLSSTRELAMEHKTNPNKKAATYGGIIYNFESADWSKELENVKNGEEIFRDVPMINGVPKAVEYLPETRRESDSINSILSSAKYTVIAKIGKDATEGSFKALSGKGLKIMHISTHGFYAPEKDLEKSNVNFFLRETNHKEDRTLSCSGLYMAGANNTLDSVKVTKNPEGLDDGILTAMEISRLDFKGLDLVVLSACQTGLGEVTGEGVFGLQRGFKKAGAQTIVMSLWKVGEESSKIWMVEFFKNLASGQSNREAFLAAQKVVRKEHPDPKDWAAFVMVDGVE